MMHSYMSENEVSRIKFVVLILVVMDDALVPIKLLEKRAEVKEVLILVVMDDALVRTIECAIEFIKKS